jgi:hypothetical protein
MATSDLIAKLVIEHPTIWGAEGPFGKPLTPHRLGRMLATSYKINSTRQDNLGPRGYLLAAFSRVWSRMLVTPPTKPAQVAEPAEPANREPHKPEEPDKPIPLRGCRTGGHWTSCANGNCAVFEACTAS